MDNEYSNDTYQFGNTSNQAGESVTQSEEVTVVQSEQNNYSYDYNSNANYIKQEKPKKTRKPLGNAKKWILCVGMAVVFGVVASVVFQTSNRLFDGIFGEDESTNKTVSTTQITTY